MQRNYNRYQYETSPRKIKPEYTPTQNNPYKQKKSTTVKKNNNKIKAKNKKGKTKIILFVLAGFAVLFAISYRNAQIDESFSKIQELKKELAVIEKENEQLEVTIESDLNLSNLENQAREQLGMTKLTNKQTKYVNLPKDDYIETGTEKIVIEKDKFSINEVLNIFKSIFK